MFFKGPLYGDTSPYSIAYINDRQEVVKFLEDKGLIVNYVSIIVLLLIVIYGVDYSMFIIEHGNA